MDEMEARGQAGPPQLVTGRAAVSTSIQYGDHRWVPFRLLWKPDVLLTTLLQFHPAAHSASSIKQRFLGYTEEESGVCLPGQVG